MADQPNKQKPATAPEPPVVNPSETSPVGSSAAPGSDVAAAALVGAPVGAAGAMFEPGVKMRETVGHEPVVDRVDASHDRFGEVSSAELKTEPLRAGFPAYADRVQDVDETMRFAGTLPAETRVLASGREVGIPKRVDDGETLLFTATTRTLRNDKIYEVGAPIPLTRTEFETKRAVRAIAEAEFYEGE